VQKSLRGDQKGQETPVRRVPHQGREADRHRSDRRAQLYLRPVPRRPTKGRAAGMPLRSVRFRVHAPVSGHVRELQEAKAVLVVLVPGHGQSEEEDGLLV